MIARVIAWTAILAVCIMLTATASPLDTVSTFPYVQDFEGAATSWTTGTIGGGPNDWVIGTPAKVQLSGARSGIRAFVTKVTGTYSNSQSSYIQSPTFDMTALTGIVTIEFWHNFATQPEWDGGVLELSVDGGSTWLRVDSTLGTPPGYLTALSSGWYNTANGFGNIPPPFWSDVSTSYAGSSGGWVKSTSAIGGIAGLPDVRFRWRFSSDATDAFEGWAIDDVRVSALPPHDISVAGVSIPGYTGGPGPGELILLRSGEGRFIGGTAGDAAPAGVLAGSPVTLDAVVWNYGSSVEPSYQVGWRFDAIPQADVSNTAPLAVAGRETLELTLASPPPGIHTVKAWSILPTDPFPANDSSGFTFEVLDSSVVFYEGFNGSTFPPPGWIALNGDGNTGPVTTWYSGSFAGPQEGSGVAGDDYRTANGFFINDYLITPSVGSALDAFNVDSLSFYLIATGGSFPDSVEIRVSTSTADPGSFTTLLEYIRPTGSWTRYTYALPSGTNRYVAFRYLLYDGGPSGSSSDAIGLDNVRITRYTFAAVLASPDTIAFGSVAVGTTGSDTVVVSNTGNLPLDITGASIVGSSDFAVFPPGIIPIPPGGTASLFVSYAPTVVGPAAASLLITHTGDNTPSTVVLTGAGIQPAFALSAVSVAFDSVAVDSSLTDSVRVSNPGSASLEIASPVCDNPASFTVAPAGPVTLQPGGEQWYTVTFHPTTAGVKTGRILFSHNAPGSPDTVLVTGKGYDLIPIVFLTLTPSQVFDEDPLKPGKSAKAAKRAKFGKPVDPFKNVPNRSNILNEIVAQGAFAPRTTESDSAGGMVIGVSHMYLKDPIKKKWAVVKDSAAIRCWMRMSKWDFKKSIGKNYKDFQKTLFDKLLGFHDGAPGGLDFTTDGKNKVLVKQLKKLTPKKHDNALLAELVALKVNIAASQLGTTPVGYGDLIYENDGNPYDEMSILAISAKADTMMTYWQGYLFADFQQLYDVMYDLNRAFPGSLPLDTVQFNAYAGGIPLPLVVEGEVALASVPYLKVPEPFVATTVPRLNSEVEAPEEFGDEEEEEEGVPVAAKLYGNYPNPFNPGTTLSFRLLEDSRVTIRIYNMLGQQVADLLNGEEMEEGYNEVRFSAGLLSSGVYFYRIDVQGLGGEGLRSVLTGKMILLK